MNTATWSLASVTTRVEENERGGSQHATFTAGDKSVTFMVVGMKQDGDIEPYTFADWTLENGDSDRRYGDQHAARVEGSCCPKEMIARLGAGLNDGTIPAISPNIPDCNTEAGISKYLERGLEGFTALRKARREAYAAQQLPGHADWPLESWLVLGRYWLDRGGNTQTAQAPLHNARVVLNTHTGAAAGMTYSGRAIASHEDTCTRCGRGWELSDAHEIVVTRDPDESLLWHTECRAFALHESTRREFAEVVRAAGLVRHTLRAIPNRYGSASYNGPWFLVASPIGDIRLGWRKRVIEIAWTEGPDARELFADEPVTKSRSLVHAYSCDDASKYLTQILAAASKDTAP